MFRVLDDAPGTFRRWRQIVQSHAVKGRQAHDARLVALMVELGIDCVLTFNLDDFRRYHEIRAISPHSLVSLPSEPAKSAE